MKPVELEIVSRMGKVTTEIIEVAEDATTMTVVKAVRKLCRMCGWRKVRVNIGDLWSGWLY